MESNCPVICIRCRKEHEPPRVLCGWLLHDFADTVASAVAEPDEAGWLEAYTNSVFDAALVITSLLDLED